MLEMGENKFNPIFSEEFKLLLKIQSELSRMARIIVSNGFIDKRGTSGKGVDSTWILYDSTEPVDCPYERKLAVSKFYKVVNQEHTVLSKYADMYVVFDEKEIVHSEVIKLFISFHNIHLDKGSVFYVTINSCGNIEVYDSTEHLM